MMKSDDKNEGNINKVKKLEKTNLKRSCKIPKHIWLTLWNTFHVQNLIPFHLPHECISCQQHGPKPEKDPN
jgi:hypothetical protein